MDDLFKKIALCVERGKVKAESRYPPELKGQEGADELTKKALDQGSQPRDILNLGLISGMQRVGEKFKNNEIYLPDVLVSAKAMSAAMEHLKPYFKSGEVEHKGQIVMGTVAGDLHDIGKKIVAMFLEGSGWEVIDCGVDVTPQDFILAIRKNNPLAVGMSALLTTTMVNMREAVRTIKSQFPKVKILVGGAPITHKFSQSIGADMTSDHPQEAVEYLENSVSKNKG
ncbi:MAG: cobalamin-binding protein [Candidatus Aminicenantes bacterium]|nr:cobalamin-binding protein [Candidatus Aminicenantes bacterium]